MRVFRLFDNRKFSTSIQLFKKSSRLLKKNPQNKISLTPKFLDSVKEWPKLLQAENEAKFEQLNEMIKSKTDWKIIEDRGLCLGNLVLKSKYVDVLNGEVLVLSGDSVERSRQFKPGVPVVLNKLNEEGELTVVTEGHVVECSESILKISSYNEGRADYTTSNYILTQSTNSGVLKYLQDILKDSSTLSSDSVHLVNLAYRSIPMPSIHDKNIRNLPETLNPSQEAAVSAALNTQRNLLCIQGPPGTGKTRVIAEIVHQLIRKKKRVLVCAPTHVAVKNALNATSRRLGEEISEGNVENKLLNLSTVRQEFMQHPLIEKLSMLSKEVARDSAHNRELQGQCSSMQIKIFRDIFSPKRAVFSTLATSFIQKLPFYRWNADVMLIDEAAQCTEPSTWVPVLTTPHCKKLVLVGDQRQLPAVVLSEKAKKSNLETSLMEKLADEFKGSNINILLKEQYRMNKKIMRWSNETFYDDELKANSDVADITLRDICPNIPEGSVLNEPILMIDMDRCEEKSGEEDALLKSFMNRDEINIVTKYVNRMVVDVGLDPKSIAVIAPYFAQINELRKSIPFPVDINTVDAFQGHERQLVIFCLVRDNTQGIIGFLNEIRRLNVAITRAKRQFLLVGSGRMLKQNKHLKRLKQILQSENVIYGSEILEAFDDVRLPS